MTDVAAVPRRLRAAAAAQRDRCPCPDAAPRRAGRVGARRRRARRRGARGAPRRAPRDDRGADRRAAGAGRVGHGDVRRALPRPRARAQRALRRAADRRRDHDRLRPHRHAVRLGAGGRRAPDFLCLSKGITGGYLPLSCVLTHRRGLRRVLRRRRRARLPALALVHRQRARLPRGAGGARHLPRRRRDRRQPRHGAALARARRAARRAPEGARLPAARHDLRLRGRDRRAPISRAGASPRRSRASCCCARSGAPSTSCRPTSSPTTSSRCSSARTPRSSIAHESATGRPERDRVRSTASVLRWRSRAAGARACGRLLGAAGDAAAPGRPRVPRRRRAARRASASSCRRSARAQPLFAHERRRGRMNPASVMKLVTTLRRARAARPRLPLEDRGLPRRPARPTACCTAIWCSRATATRRSPSSNGRRSWRRCARAGSTRSTATSCSTARTSRRPRTIPAAFDSEPLKPYNVGPDALLVNFKSVRFAFAPNAAGDGVDARASSRRWRRSRVGAAAAARQRRLRRLARPRSARASSTAAPARRRASRGRYPATCGERDWWVALLDHPTYVHGMFDDLFPRGRRPLRRRLEERRARRRAPRRSPTLESPPLYDIVRDVNKLSNNVMARQVFLTLGDDARARRRPPPPRPPRPSTRWLARPQAADARAACSRTAPGCRASERISAGSLARLLRAADASPVREEFASSLAVAAIDGTRAAAVPERQRRRPGAAQDRHARRRARARRLRDRRRAAGAGSSSRSSTTRTRRARRRRSTTLVQWVYRDAPAGRRCSCADRMPLRRGSGGRDAAAATATSRESAGCP